MTGMSDIYSELGVRKMINAAGTYTVAGGSRMSEKTLEDMKSAAGSFVEIRKLQKVINAEIARMTKNEAAFVTCGAAAGLFLSVCAAVQLKYGKARHFYMDRRLLSEYNVVVFKSHRNPYDFTIQEAGLSYQEIGYPNFILPATEEDLIRAIDEKTAAVYYVHAVWTPEGALSLEKTIKIAHENGVPVIVDAAAQLPPLENLWKFTQMGADAALFSGGKDIRGPQSSGLVLGKKAFIDAVSSIGFPNYGAGRMLKTGREELVGLYSALKQYVEMDHEKRADWCEGEVLKLVDAFAGSDLFSAERDFPNEAGQPIARALVMIKDGKISSDAVQKGMLEGEPSVYLMTNDEKSFFINPMTLYPGETEIIIERLKGFEV